MNRQRRFQSKDKGAGLQEFKQLFRGPSFYTGVVWLLPPQQPWKASCFAIQLSR
jgi:hypothetical protein